MKGLVLRFLLAILQWRVRKLLQQSGSKVIAITGSVGKTTCKKVLGEILAGEFSVHQSPRSFNTPLGLILSCLKIEAAPGKNLRSWVKIFHRAFLQKVTLPQVLVLEFGADRPGDIAQLAKIVRPDFAIVTAVAPVHLARGQFTSLAQIAQEKMQITKSVREFALVGDNPLCRKFAHPGKVQFFGPGKCDWRIEFLQSKADGFSFALGWESFFVPVFGDFQVSSFFPAVVLALHLGVGARAIANTLKNFQLPPGRGRIFKGVRGSQIIDSSFNASPLAVERSLQALRKMPGARKICLLGQMNELGENSSKFHFQAGKQAAKVCDRIFFVGESWRDFARGAGEHFAGHFANSSQAGKALKSVLRKGDLLLVKGSRHGINLEKAVAQVLANAGDRGKLV